MPRPMKWRRVAFIPQFTYFKPAGIPMRALDEVALSVEEAEAIRLKDLEGLQQEECATLMYISRPTFHRVLESARTKIADAIINGKAIRIDGGNFEIATRRFRCGNDGVEWDAPIEPIAPARPLICPECNSPQVQPVIPPGFHGHGRGGGRGRHRGGRGW
ncbi:MAG: DUF134 domain-containing protein [Chloroflexota bacterium]|nr:DUF134 domain-containing protein [Chloroflexota bacterium]